MSWESRLLQLKDPSTSMTQTEKQHHQQQRLDPVFLSGSRFLNDEILKHVSLRYSWADISNVSFSSLKKKYGSDFQKIVNYLINNREYSKIYKHCNIDLILIKTVNAYINRQVTITKYVLDDIYNECSALLHDCDVDITRTVFVLDFRRCYFESNYLYISELLLYAAASLALVNKSKLFPFIDLVLISDDDSLNSNDDDIENDAILYLQKCLIKMNLNVFKTIDIEYITKLIVNSHLSSDIDGELF